MQRRVLWTFILGAISALAAPQGCVGSFAVANFRFTVAPNSGGPASFLAMRRVNNLPSGYRIRYQPDQLPADLSKDAKLAVVVVPKAADGQLTVLEPRSVIAATEWTVPFTARIVVVVFAPQGLDEKRLANLVTRDQNLIAALADYADQTAGLEASMDLLNAVDEEIDEDLDKPGRIFTPTEQALLALVRALNPTIASANPLGAGRRTGAATLMGKGADAFFENAGGLVPGGGILPTVKTWLLPDTEFRAVYSSPVGDSDMMALCAQVQARSRNKMAYLWAYRLNGAPAPAPSITRTADLPLGTRASLPLRLEKNADWRLMNRAQEWTLVSDAGPALKIPARASEDDHTLQLDLRKFPGGPGAYRLEARWDWDAMKVAGTVQLHRLEDLSTAAVTADSQDRLIAGTGPAIVDVTGPSFLFLEKVALHRAGSTRMIPLDLPPDRSGPLHLELDTDTLRPGSYLIALSRSGSAAEVPVRIHPAPPKLTGLPLRINTGDREQTVVLSGSGLDRIEKLESDAADIVLQPAVEDGTRRAATVRLRATAKPGDRITLAAKLDGQTQSLRFPGVFQIAAARPRIREAKSSLPRDLPITPRDGEIPAGSWISFAVRVEPAGIQPALTVQCADPTRAVTTASLRAGEKSANAQWAPAGDAAWFLSLDPGAFGQSGCTLEAVVETEALGKSDPFALGKVVRLPRIEAFAMTDEKSPEGFVGSLRGFDLETVEKTGWTPQSGIATQELPRPVAGEGARQTLRISMPWPSPSPKSPLYVWLRGETEGRATRVTQ